MPRLPTKRKVRIVANVALVAVAAMSLSGCATIEEMGHIGSNKVYSVSSNGFMNSTQMILVMNKKGDVAAYTGGTTEGVGAIALQTGGTVLTAGAIAYAGHAIQHGLETTNVQTTGIPSTFNIKGTLDTNHSIHIDPPGSKG